MKVKPKHQNKKVQPQSTTHTRKKETLCPPPAAAETSGLPRVKRRFRSFWVVCGQRMSNPVTPWPATPKKRSSKDPSQETYQESHGGQGWWWCLLVPSRGLWIMTTPNRNMDSTPSSVTAGREVSLTVYGKTGGRHLLEQRRVLRQGHALCSKRSSESCRIER